MKKQTPWTQVIWVASLMMGVGHVQADGQVPPTPAFAADAQPAAPAGDNDFQAKLLDLAMQAASQIPIEPHIKDRSRAQEDVVAVCLSLNHTERALNGICMIADWRRGAAYADFAFHLVKRQDARDVEKYLALATDFALSAEDWRRDRINAKIERVRSLMAEHQRADQFTRKSEASQRGKLEAVKASCDEAEFDSQLRSLERAAAERDFDATRDALDAVAQLFDRCYQDLKRRTQVEKQIRSAWQTAPEMVRLKLLMTMSEFALAHEDHAKALQLVNEATTLLNSFQWSPEYRITCVARLAGLRFRAGDAIAAHSQIHAAMVEFDSDREKIMGIDQAGVWRTIAEAHKAMGEPVSALESYRKALELGANNPNARPRALDLSATCRSMALSAVEPDTELWARLHQLREGLIYPW